MINAMVYIFDPVTGKDNQYLHTFDNIESMRKAAKNVWDTERDVILMNEQTNPTTGYIRFSVTAFVPKPEGKRQKKVIFSITKGVQPEAEDEVL